MNLRRFSPLQMALAVSLALHAADKREYVYSESQFDKGATHDDLWNAAQLEMVHGGKMHGACWMSVWMHCGDVWLH